VPVALVQKNECDLQHGTCCETAGLWFSGLGITSGESIEPPRPLQAGSSVAFRKTCPCAWTDSSRSPPKQKGVEEEEEEEDALGVDDTVGVCSEASSLFL